MAVYGLKKKKKKKRELIDGKLQDQAAGEAPAAQEPAAQEPAAQEPAAAEPEQPRAETPGTAEPSPAESRQPDNVTVEKVDGGVRVNIGPTNRPMTEDQAFLLEQRKQVRNVDMQLTEASPLENLPEVLEPHRDALEEKNESGGFIPSSVRSWGNNKADIYLDTIMDERQLAYTMTVLGSDEEKVGLAKAWADLNGVPAEDVVFRAEELLGNRLFDSPQSAQGILNAVGMVDLDGERIDMRSADFSSLVTAAQCIPDDSVRKQVFGLIDGLTKVKGGRFYGLSLDGVSTAFRDTKDMPLSDYKKFVGDISSQFYGSEGHEEDNLRAYLNIYDSIHGENSALTNVQKHWYQKALDDAFGWQVHGDKSAGGIPDPEKARAVLDEYDAAKQAAYDAERKASEGGKEEDESFGQKAKEWLSSAGDSIKTFFSDLVGGKQKDVPAEEVKTPEAEEPARPSLPSEESPEDYTPEDYVPEEEKPEEEEPEVQGPAYRPEAGGGGTPEVEVEAHRPNIVTSAPDAPGNSQIPRLGGMLSDAPAESVQPHAEDGTAEVQGPVYQPAAAPKRGSVNLAHDIGAALEYARSGRGDLLDEETAAALDQFYQSAGPGMRALLGEVSPEYYRKYSTGNEPPEYMWLRHTDSVLGSTLTNYSLRIHSEDFPGALYGDAVMYMSGIMQAAESDPTLTQAVIDAYGGRYEAYIARNPDVLAPLENVFNQILDMQEEAAANDAAAQAARDADLARDRQAVAIGQASDEQRRNVLEAAKPFDMMRAMEDPTYVQFSETINQEYFRAEVTAGEQQDSFFSSWVYKTMKSRGVTDLDSGESLYEGMLSNEMLAVLHEDMRLAQTLGMDLKTYYGKQGGMTMEYLAQRANARILQTGDAISEQELAGVEEIVAGEKSGIGIKNVGELSALTAYNQTVGGFLETAIMVSAATDIPRDAAKVQTDYNYQYQPIWGRTACAADLRALAETGKLPPELNDAIIRYLDEGGDPYQLGINPKDYGGGLVDSYAETQDRLRWYQHVIAENATEGETLAIELGSNTVSNTALMLGSMGVSAVAAPVAGPAAPYIGLRLVYGGAQEGAAMREWMRKGYTIKEAKALAGAQMSAEAVANMVSLGHLDEQFKGFSSLVLKGVSGMGGANGTKAAQTLYKGMSRFVPTLASDLLEEGVKDPMLEGVLGAAATSAVASAIEDVRSGENINVLRAIVTGAGAGVQSVPETVAIVIDEAPEQMLAALPLAILGATGEALKASDSYKAADALVQNPTPEAFAAFDAAVQQDAKDERWVSAIFAEGKQAEIEQETAAILAFGPDRELFAAAQKRREQADSHKAALEASETRLEEGWAAYDEGEANGDVDAQLAALDTVAKAKQGMEEHAREFDQKNLEARTAEDALFKDAHSRAVTEVNQRRATAKRQTKEAADARARAAQEAWQVEQERLNAIDEEIEEITAQLVETEDEQAAEELGRRYNALLEEQASLEASLDEQARVALEKDAQQNQLAREKAEMAPVFSTLYHTPVYVDEAQANEIRNRTGLTIPQFNRKYGFRLTTDKGKSRNSLDGSFFADLATQASGHIDAETAHPEEAIVALAERKKELSGVQAAIGSTDADAYMTDITYGIEDPETAKLAGDLHKKTGITLVVANLEDGKRGWYDRRNNQVVLSNRLGAGEMRRAVVMHELTHFIEGAPGYEAYKKAVLRAAYTGGEEQRAAMIERDREDLREEYAANGVVLSDDELDAELVAAATERVIGGDELFFDKLIQSGHRGFLTRVYMKVKQFLSRRNAKKAGKEELAHYDDIQRAHDLMEKALKGAPKREAQADGKTQYALGWTTDGRQYVEIEEDILDGLPESEWAKAAKDALKKFSNGIPVGRNTIYVSKKTHGEWTNSKDARRTERLSPEAYMDKLRAANHADEILWASTDYINEEADHNRTDNMQDFARGKVLLFVGGNGYQADVVVGLRPDESLLLYDVTHIEPAEIKKKKPQNSNGSRESVPISQSVTSDISVQQNAPDVKNQSMQNGPKYSIGVRQFGETMQRSDIISDSVKEMIRGTEYEKDTNREQVKRATETLDRDGMDATVSSLLRKDRGSYTADDNALAFVAIAEATRNGDDTTAAMLAMHMQEEAGEQGRALQSLKIGLKLTPEGAMGEAIRKANKANEQHGVPEGSFPVGEEPPKQGGTQSGENGTTAKTPEAVEKVYRSAETLNAVLDQLPGDVSYDNPWHLPLSRRQTELISHYKLTGEKLPGRNYNMATLKQRMLAAIVAAGPEIEGDSQKALCQQLEAMKSGHAVVTKADLTYIAGQMAEFRMLEGTEAVLPKTQEGRIALGRAYQAQDNVKQEGFFSKWSALRFMNMLSAPATAVRNVSSNILASGLENTATVIATAVDKAVSQKTGNRTTATATKTETQEARRVFAGEVARTFSDYFVTHVDTGHGRKYETGGNGRVFESELLEGCRNLVDFAMQIGDRPFYEKTYAQELAIIKRLGMKKTEMKDGKIVSRPMTETELHEEATARALKRVFQEDNLIIDEINRVKAKSPKADLIISTLMPFIKTPTNVAMRAIEYSPLGFGNAFARAAMYGIDSGRKGSISQRDFVMGIGRGLTGTGLMVVGYALAAAGAIGFGRSEEEDDRRRGVLGALGEPYGMYLNIFGTRHEIDWAMPMSSAIAMGAEFFRSLDDGEGLAEAAFGAIISGVGDQIMSTPMLSSMNEIFRGYDNTEDIFLRLAQTGAASLVNQTFSPAAIRALAKATDPYVRDTGSSSALWSMLNQNLVQYWPGVRQMLPIKTDITGDKQLQSGYWNPEGEHGNRVMQYLDSFLTPTATIGEKNDEALLELLDMSYRTGESSFLPTTLISANKYEVTLNKSYAGDMGYGDEAINMQLTDEEKRSANTDFGNLLFNGDGGRPYVVDKSWTMQDFPGLRAVMNDEAKYKSATSSYEQDKPWSQMTDEERIKLVNQMRSDAKRVITIDIARRKKGAGEI